MSFFSAGLATALSAMCFALTLACAPAETFAGHAYVDHDPKGGGVVNKMDFFEFAYTKSGGREYTRLKYAFAPEIGKMPNGFWIVVSDGPNPKTHVNEYAILYGDLKEYRVTAYVYSGKNNGNSFRVENGFVDSFDDALIVDVDKRSVAMTIDVTNINAFVPKNSMANDWDGVAIGSNVGIWFHPADFMNVRYGQAGDILAGDIKGRGWLDFANRSGREIEVSEPATPLLFGLCLLIVGLRQRKRGLAA